MEQGVRELPRPGVDVALCKLYRSQPMPPRPDGLKPHPYQSFDIGKVFKPPSKAETAPANVTVRNNPTTSLNGLQPVYVDDLEDSSTNVPTKDVALGAVTDDIGQVFMKLNLSVAPENTCAPRISTANVAEIENKKAAGGAEALDQTAAVKETTLQAKAENKFRLAKYKLENVIKGKLKRTRKPYWKCVLCQKDIPDNEAEVEDHIRSEQHRDRKLRIGRNETLKLLPNTVKSGPHTTKLDQLIHETFESVQTSPDKIQLGLQLLGKYNAILRETGKSLILTGSLEHRICLENGDVNLALLVGEKRSCFQGISHVKSILSALSFVESLRLVPTGVLHFVDAPTAMKVTVTVFAESAHGTTSVLKEYSDFIQRKCPEAWKVLCCFRYWANVSGLDRKDDGMLHGYMFCVMAIDLLQKLGAVPVLATMRSTEQAEKWEPMVKRTAGELWWSLWVELMHFRFEKSVFCINQYATPLREQKGLGVKRLAIESPGDTKINLCRDVPGAVAFDRLVDSVRASAYYFCIPQLKSGPLFHVLYPSVPPQPMRRLRKITDDEDIVLRKRSDSQSCEKENKPSDGKDRKASESATSRKSVSSESELSRNRYDSVASSEGLVVADDEDDELEVTFEEVSEADFRSNGNVVRVETATYEKIVIHDSGGEDSSVSVEESDNELPEENLDDNMMENIDGNLTANLDGIVRMSVKQAIQETEKLSPDDMEYFFQQRILTDGKKLLKLCSFCKNNGHNAATCPDVVLPPVKPLPALTHDHFRHLEDSLYNKCNRLKPSPHDLANRRSAIAEIQSYVQQRFATAIIQPFGSCSNGFGFSGSDLDLCLIFTDHPTGEGVDCVGRVKQLTLFFRKNPKFQQVTAILTAKVPIVKAFYKPYRVELDISIYNTLGLMNTRLLYTYATIDERVQNLGYLAKHLAKTCDVGDASKGTLSSYAYILLVLNYAQRCNPPLIPNLQELYDRDLTTPERIVDGWNTWFFEASPGLPWEAVWPGFRRNKDPLSVHWLNFLCYYGDFFDWTNYVVSIRQLSPLPKLDKNWADRDICIEDPFNLAHNLGAGLTLKMATHIKSVFIECREHFGIPSSTLPTDCRSWQEYFWHRRFLVKSALPNDRPGCFKCGSVRHRKNDCPRLMSNRQNNPRPNVGKRTDRKESDNSKRENPGTRNGFERKVEIPSNEVEKSHKYQPRGRNRRSESEASQGAQAENWRKYVPSGKREKDKEERKGRQKEDWPELPISAGRGRAPAPLRDSANTAKRVDAKVQNVERSGTSGRETENGPVQNRPFKKAHRRKVTADGGTS